MDTHRRIFLSAASAETKPLRGRLDAILRRSGFNCELQEIFPTTDSDTVRKLGDLIKNCGLVLHIVGHKPGAIADAQAVRDLLAHIPADQFLAQWPELRAALGDFSGITYTQWEAFLALHYRIPLVASCINNLASLLKATNRLAEAVRILENSLGSEHPKTVIVKGNLQRLQDAMRGGQNP